MSNKYTNTYNIGVPQIVKEVDESVNRDDASAEVIFNKDYVQNTSVASQNTSVAPNSAILKQDISTVNTNKVYEVIKHFYTGPDLSKIEKIVNIMYNNKNIYDIIDIDVKHKIEEDNMQYSIICRLYRDSHSDIQLELSNPKSMIIHFFKNISLDNVQELKKTLLSEKQLFAFYYEYEKQHFMPMIIDAEKLIVINEHINNIINALELINNYNYDKMSTEKKKEKTAENDKLKKKMNNTLEKSIIEYNNLVKIYNEGHKRQFNTFREMSTQEKKYLDDLMQLFYFGKNIDFQLIAYKRLLGDEIKSSGGAHRTRRRRNRKTAKKSRKMRSKSHRRKR